MWIHTASSSVASRGRSAPLRSPAGRRPPKSHVGDSELAEAIGNRLIHSLRMQEQRGRVRRRGSGKASAYGGCRKLRACFDGNAKIQRRDA